MDVALYSHELAAVAFHQNFFVQIHLSSLHHHRQHLDGNDVHQLRPYGPSEVHDIAAVYSPFFRGMGLQAGFVSAAQEEEERGECGEAASAKCQTLNSICFEGSHCRSLCDNRCQCVRY